MTIIVKKIFKRRVLAALITSLLSNYAYSETIVNVDGSFTTSELDTEVTSSSLKKQINNLLTNSNLNHDEITKNSSAKTNSRYYPVNEKGENIMENSVTYITGIPNNEISLIYGGYCENPDGDCEVKNTNIVGTGNWSAQFIYGAYAYSSFHPSYVEAIGNVYLMDNVTVEHDVHGTFSSGPNSSKAYGNVYLMDNTTILGRVYGAYSYMPDGEIIGNAYLMDNTKVSGNVYGVYAIAPRMTYVTGNVYLTDNAIVAKDIFGVYGDYTSNATGNVYIYGNVKLQDDSSGETQYNTSIFGGYLRDPSKYYNIFNNNLLSIGNAPLTVKNVGNFANYDFYLNDYNKSAIDNNVALLTITESMQNSNTAEDNSEGGINYIKNKSTVHVAGISGQGIVSVGDEITLIDASKSDVKFIQGDNTSTDVTTDISELFKTQTGDKDINVKIGLVAAADISYTVDSNNNKIIAKIDDIRINKDSVNLNVKPLAEGRLAGIQNTVRGADLLVDAIQYENKPVGTFTPIALISGSLNKYNSGSHIDTRDYHLMVGSRYQLFDNLYTGLTLEYGRSHFDTYNNFSSGRVKGNGHTYNYGVSLFSRLSSKLESDNELYIDSALRFGRTSTEFNSNDIITGSGDRAYYKSNANYYGVNLGTGYIYNLNPSSSFDTSVRYLWTRLGSDSVVIDGDKVNFETSNSSRVQLKEQYSYKSSDVLTFTLATIYEYEFDGKAKANISGVGINAPSVKGSTGIMEFGVKGTPIANNKDLSFNMSFKGYTGKRDGASASAFVEYDF